MNFLETMTKGTLSKVVLENLGRPVDYEQIEIDRAVKAADSSSHYCNDEL